MSDQSTPPRGSVSVEEHRAAAPEQIRCAVLTVSDTRTPETDKSGGLIRDLLTASGHVVVEPEGARDQAGTDVVMTRESAEAVRRVLAIAPVAESVRGSAPRLLVSGLLTSANNSTGVRVIGAVPEREELLDRAATIEQRTGLPARKWLRMVRPLATS